MAKNVVKLILLKRVDVHCLSDRLRMARVECVQNEFLRKRWRKRNEKESSRMFERVRERSIKYESVWESRE